MSKQRAVAIVVGNALLVYGSLTALCNYWRVQYFALNTYAAIASKSMGPLHPSKRYPEWLLMEVCAVGALLAMPIIGAAILRKSGRLVAGLLVLALIEFINVIASMYWQNSVNVGAGWYWEWGSFLRTGAELFRMPILFLATALVARYVLSRKGDPPTCVGCEYQLNGLTEPRCPECGRVYTLDEFHRL
jgi:hypothetical protein